MLNKILFIYWRKITKMNKLPAEKETNTTLPTVNRLEEVITKLSQSVGISYMAAANLLSQALKSSIPTTNTPTPEWEYIGAMLASFEPRNVQEAMLACQMVGVHNQTIELLSKATKYDALFAKEEYLKLALKMSRLFATQLETLKKIRSKGEQRMVVEHVHIHNGAQAIVGNIASDKV
jgi:hypothetical protein